MPNTLPAPQDDLASGWQERFDPEAAVRLIATERCTVYYGMSHMAQAMLETPAWGRATPGRCEPA